MIFEQLNLKGKKYRVFVPHAILNDDTKNLLREVFGEDIAIFPSDDIEIWAESNSVVNTSTVVGSPAPVIAPEIPIKRASDDYMKEHGTIVSKNEGRAAGW